MEKEKENNERGLKKQRWTEGERIEGYRERL